MCKHHVDFGFAQAELPAGSHMCQIYDDNDERNDSLLKFIASGIKQGECNACFSENITREEVAAFLEEQGLDLPQAEQVCWFSGERNLSSFS